MKILSIRLKNLASLAGEHFIDFECDPLAHAGLIAIIGKTGAGKSTILDAMCLALFNKIPRLKESDGKLLDVDGSELLTNSPLTVLRRGTGHGFAELCFVAQDQKHYQARWEIKRARENASGKLQSVQRSLKCLTDGVVVADKSKAVESHIQQITQLSFEQFTRAVLLAQSEVTAFLKARDTERGELLEYLTNSSIFAKIGQLAFEKTREMTNQRKQLENVLGHIEIRTDEDVAAIQAQFQQTQQQVQQLETERTQLKQQQQWFEQQQKLESEITIKQRQHETHAGAGEHPAGARTCRARNRLRHGRVRPAPGVPLRPPAGHRLVAGHDRHGAPALARATQCPAELCRRRRPGGASRERWRLSPRAGVQCAALGRRPGRRALGGGARAGPRRPAHLQDPVRARDEPVGRTHCGAARAHAGRGTTRAGLR